MLCHKLCKFLVLWNVFLNAGFQVKGAVFLEEAEDQQELFTVPGSEFTLTCHGDVPLAWDYPNYEPADGEEKSTIKENLIENGEGQQKFVSKLTVSKAYFLDTGYFTCFQKGGDPKSEDAKKVYVYVQDPNRPLAVDTTFMHQIVYELGTIKIPCKPTDPNIRVVLKKDNKTFPRESYDPHVGFTIQVDNQSELGFFDCQVEGADDVEDVSFYYEFKQKPKPVSLEIPHIKIDPSPVVAGENINLTCAEHHQKDTSVNLVWELPPLVESSLNQTGRFKLHSPVTTEEHHGKKAGHGAVQWLTIHKLELFNVSKADGGVFTCHVSDAHNNNNKSVELKISDKPVLEFKAQGLEDTRRILVHAGQPSAVVIVNIEAFPPPKSIQWYNNKMTPISRDTGSEEYTVETSEDKKRTKLVLNKPDVFASGTYTLRVSHMVANVEVSKSTNFTFEVEGLPQLRVNGGVEVQFYMAGQTRQVDCEVFGFPRPTIKWLSRPCPAYPDCGKTQFSLIPESKYNELVVATDQGSPLKSTVELRGDVTRQVVCRAQNSLGMNEDTVTLLITDVEGGFSIDVPSSVVETDNVTLSCGVSKYHNSKTLKWFYTKSNDKALTLITDLKTWDEETKHSYLTKLNIPNVTKSQSGNYTCVANFQGRKEMKSYFIQVMGLKKPTINKKNTGSKAMVKIGHTLKLNCSTEGSPPPRIIWFKDDEEIVWDGRDSSRELKDNNQTLVIHVGLDDEARYKCHAVNKAGRDVLEIMVVVEDKPLLWLYAWFVVPILLLMVIILAILGARYCMLKRKYKSLKAIGLETFYDGKVEAINPDLGIVEQADLLPYDRKKWEFPRDKLKLGKQLGCGAFGRVVEAEAYGLRENEEVTKVAVKMVKSDADPALICALASELKIMIHLGRHLNVVNVLGACTDDLAKKELLVLVEYCRYGNLLNYLKQHRATFVNQVNPLTGTFDATFIEPISPRSTTFSNGDYSIRTSAAFSQATDTTMVVSDGTAVGEDGYLMTKDQDLRNKDKGNYDTRPICTQDLICWAFQIARGMEYLAYRKVLHGDLAARNVLLADRNVVKICDFGFSKSIYKDDNYQKKGDAKLPVKWLALESLRERIFSTQSDVWAYGVTLWELFSLACDPYPGMGLTELYGKLVRGYRLEQPKYATKQMYQVMVDCWHENPHSRPSFTELCERMGGMLEDTVKKNYVDLNDPFLAENREFLAQQDYLSMVRSPTYNAATLPPDYLTMIDELAPGENYENTDNAMELTPMLTNANSKNAPDETDDSPPPISKAKGNNYVNVAHVLGFSNPSYQNLGRPKKSPYMNMPGT